MTEVSATSEIEAPIERVWEILSDLDSYSEWNRFTPKAVTTKLVGDPVVLDVQWMNASSPMQQTETITVWDETQTTIVWRLQFTPSFLLQAERSQILTQLDDDTGRRTRYHTVDRFKGPLVPLVMFLHRNKIQAGFDHVAQALKERAERQTD